MVSPFRARGPAAGRPLADRIDDVRVAGAAAQVAASASRISVSSARRVLADEVDAP